MLEMAFDWDSPLTAEAWREVGERCAALGDWTKACISLRKSLDGLDAICGRRDKRALEVARLLAVSLFVSALFLFFLFIYLFFYFFTFLFFYFFSM